MSNKFPLSQKYIDFINTTNVSAEFLEGTTASGKTTVGAGVKFMRMVSQSKKKIHAIAAKTTGKAEETIIQQDNGILDLHRNAVYCGNGDKDYKLPHIKFEGKIIYILGYSSRDKWEMVLGAQFGCVYIDEINTADIEFIREMSTRNDYMLATLNPDDPSLPVYKEFVNRSRPFKKYENDVPPEITAELTEEPVPNWRYWFFSFADNLSLTPEQVEKKKASAPKGTKLYKNKILGLRGRVIDLVFSNFKRARHIKTKEWARRFLHYNRKLEHFVQFTAGLDTAYSQKSPDTIAMTFLESQTGASVFSLTRGYITMPTLKRPLRRVIRYEISLIFLTATERSGALRGLLLLIMRIRRQSPSSRSISNNTAAFMASQMPGRKPRLSTELTSFSAGLLLTVILFLSIAKTRLQSLKFTAGEKIKTILPRTATTIALTAVNTLGCLLKILLEVK